LAGPHDDLGDSQIKTVATSIEGQIKGKKQKNEQILSAKKFPCEESWFSGRIYLSNGKYNDQTGEYEDVSEFKIDKGQIKEMRKLQSYKIPYNWNGMDDQ
jgi:hypothetical protein